MSTNEETQTLATELLHELKATNKRLFTALITVILLWFATIGCFIWYMTLPVEEYDEQVSIQNHDGSANYIGGDLNGEVNNGVHNGD